MVYARDLKSLARKGLRVRFSPPAPQLTLEIQRLGANPWSSAVIILTTFSSLVRALV